MCQKGLLGSRRWGGGHTGVELVDASYPLDAGFGDIVERHEIEVAGDPVEGADADLVEARKEVLGHVDGLLQALGSDVCHVEFVRVLESSEIVHPVSRPTLEAHL